eukprot:449872_1
MMSSFLYILFVDLISISSSYWLSENRLTWTEASTYCQSHCNSELASIHSINNHLEATYLIKNSSAVTAGFNVDQVNIWIGLNKLNTTWSWTDHSAFNYGTDTTTKGVFPWGPGEPNSLTINEHCVEYFVGYNLLWNDEICTRLRRFLCNSCEGFLEKYLLYRTDAQFTNALEFCENTLGTSLASIHNSDDMARADHLCRVSTRDCWVGLNRLHNTSSVYSLNSFKWSDKTEFDYGRYNTHYGDYPWSSTQWIEPNNQEGNEYCVELSNDHNFEWNDMRCNAGYYFLCNKPNELCNKQQWRYLYPPHSDMNINNCQAKSVDFGPAVIAYKRWNHNNWPLKIEHTFAVHNRNRNSESKVGITVFHNENAWSGTGFDVCDFYFFGLLIDNNNNAYIVLDIIKNDMIESRNVSENTFMMKYNRYYQLHVDIIIDHPGYFNKIAFNYSLLTDTIMLSGVFIDTNSDVYGYTTSIKYLGIRNENANITVTSLFISGTADYNFSMNPLISCSLKPTIDPTIETFAPNIQPAITPTQSPSNYPSMFPSDTPTKYPTKYPSKYASNRDASNEFTDITTSQVANDASSMENNADETDEIVYIFIGIAVGLIVLCICFGVLVFVRKKMSSGKTEEPINIHNNIQLVTPKDNSSHSGNIYSDSNAMDVATTMGNEINDNVNNNNINETIKSNVFVDDQQNSEGDEELYNTEIVDNDVTPNDGNTTKGET